MSYTYNSSVAHTIAASHIPSLRQNIIAVIHRYIVTRVCMCTYILVYTCTTRVYVYPSMYMHEYACIRVSEYVYALLLEYTCTRVCICTSTRHSCIRVLTVSDYVYARVLVYTCTRVYICTRTRVYVRVFECICHAS